ncbi:hypothetical protein D3C72_1943450 [compost metagenome]
MHLQLIVRLGHELGDRMLGEEFPRHAELGRLMRQRLRAVLAEFQRLLAFRIGIGAARAFEAAGLVHGQQCP